MDRDTQEFERYLEYQQSQRARRVETLGSTVTALALATIDLGVNQAREPETQTRLQTPEYVEYPQEVISFAEPRRRQLGRFAAESAELGYGLAA